MSKAFARLWSGIRQNLGWTMASSGDIAANLNDVKAKITAAETNFGRSPKFVDEFYKF